MNDDSFLAQSRAVAQYFLLSIAVVHVYGQAEDVERPVEQFILGKEVYASKLSFGNTLSVAMEFVELFFAVILPKIVVFSVIMGFVIALKFILPLLMNEILMRFRVPSNLRAFVKHSLQFLILIGGLSVALAGVGINLLGILLSFGFIGFFITTSVAPWLNNISSGFSIEYTNKIVLGETISVGDAVGKVIVIAVEYTVLLDKNGYRIDIPNSYITTQIIRHLDVGPPVEVDQMSAFVLKDQ